MHNIMEATFYFAVTYTAFYFFICLYHPLGKVIFILIEGSADQVVDSE